MRFLHRIPSRRQEIPPRPSIRKFTSQMPQLTPLSGARLFWVTVALSMANFMEVLDVTIANVSIPSISGDLGVSPNQGTWIITSYAVANAISVLSTGWLSRRFGQVRVFTTAIVLFTVASMMCGLSFTFPMLLFFRVMQGGVSGLMVPLSQALLLGSYPPEKRGIGMAIWGMTVTIAPVMGPIIGGMITDNIGWSWIFFINVPFGLGAAFLTWKTLSDRETETKKVPVDYFGFILIVIWVGSLQVLLDKGNELDWFDSPFIVTLALTSAIAFILFLIWELTDENPIVDLRLFLIRNFTASSIAMAVGYTIFFATIIVLPLWLQTQLGYTATWAGLVVAPTGLLAVLLAPIIGKNAQRMDLRWLATIAFIVFSVLSFWRATYPPNADYWTLALPQFLQGIAIATFFTPLISLAMGSLEPAKIASGSGLMNFLRMTAASFGASLAITVWDHRNAINQTALIGYTTPYSSSFQEYLAHLSSIGIHDSQATSAVAFEVSRQVSVRSVDEVFWLCGWLFLLVIILVWTIKPTKGINLQGGH
jgi:DHA2 family multidrug resistance protein